MLYSYFHDCNVSGNCITYELCFISDDDKYGGLVTRPRVSFSVVSHSILHLHKNAIRLNSIHSPHDDELGVSSHLSDLLMAAQMI